jgi:DNA-binding transcriptional LysR family regulator
VNDRQLKSFISVAESGSFSKAAKQNYISVPAIIAQIDLLEEETGIELFIRTNHGIIFLIPALLLSLM